MSRASTGAVPRIISRKAFAGFDLAAVAFGLAATFFLPAFVDADFAFVPDDFLSAFGGIRDFTARPASARGDAFATGLPKAVCVQQKSAAARREWGQSPPVKFR